MGFVDGTYYDGERQEMYSLTGDQATALFLAVCADDTIPNIATAIGRSADGVDTTERVLRSVIDVNPTRMSPAIKAAYRRLGLALIGIMDDTGE